MGAAYHQFVFWAMKMIQIHDFNGTIETDDVSILRERLKTVRRGKYGAFYVSTASSEFPYLSIHINGGLAYVHYFTGKDHPGYQPTGMNPDEQYIDVHFLNMDGLEAGAIDMPDNTLVSSEIAIQAACEFLKSGARPEFIKWTEL